MGLFSWTNEELAATVGEAAEHAANEGRRTFVHRLNLTTASGKNDPDQILALAIEGAESHGWTLRQATPYMQTVGPNAEMVLLVFTRPEE